LLIHERRLDRDVKFNGPMRTNIEIAEEILEQFKTAQLLEKRDFEALAEGSLMDAEEITAKAMGNWYLTADDALRLGLVQGVI
jgi:ATP-dependent protease ClpP protease subunit